MIEDLAEQQNRVGEIERSIAEAKERLSQIESSLSELAEKALANSNVIEGCRLKLKNREQSMEQLSEQATRLQVEAGSMDARIKMLTDMNIPTKRNLKNGDISVRIGFNHTEMIMLHR